MTRNQLSPAEELIGRPCELCGQPLIGEAGFVHKFCADYKNFLSQIDCNDNRWIAPVPANERSE